MHSLGQGCLNLVLRLCRCFAIACSLRNRVHASAWIGEWHLLARKGGGHETSKAEDREKKSDTFFVRGKRYQMISAASRAYLEMSQGVIMKAKHGIGRGPQQNKKTNSSRDHMPSAAIWIHQASERLQSLCNLQAVM